jgi:hypothetical protein
VRLENDIPNFGPYQKKRDDKYCAKVIWVYKRLTKYVFVVCIIKTSIRNNQLCAFKQQVSLHPLI